MAISNDTDAASARDKAQHLFHVAETALAKLKPILIDLDAYLAPAHGAQPMDGDGKPPTG